MFIFERDLNTRFQREQIEELLNSDELKSNKKIFHKFTIIQILLFLELKQIQAIQQSYM